MRKKDKKKKVEKETVKVETLETQQTGESPEAVESTGAVKDQAEVKDTTPPGEASQPTATTESSVDTTDWHDRYLRLAAEFDNFRRRSAREFESMVRNAESQLIADLTEVLDNVDRAVSAADQGDGPHGQDDVGDRHGDIIDGVRLIREQFWQALSRRGLTRMDTVGERFDPARHEALMQQPSDDFELGVISCEVSPGYMLADRVLRHARVIVSSGAAKAEPVEETPDSNDDSSQ